MPDLPVKGEPVIAIRITDDMMVLEIDNCVVAVRSGSASTPWLTRMAFARWFAAHTRTTPRQWLTSQRLILAQELLERTDHGIERIAADCGLAPMMLRRHFTHRWGITPGVVGGRHTVRSKVSARKS